ncbi:MAG: tryptophan halogenase family protein [Pseudomonadota bacterium]
MPGTLKQIVIVGGGAAGWMTAAALSKLLRPGEVSLTLVESDEIGIIGVGEATIPDMLQFNLFLGIVEAELMRATQATFKLGIEFVDWSRNGSRYFHPFGFHGVDIDGVDFHQHWLSCRAHGHEYPIGDYCLTEIVARKNKFGFPDTRVAGEPASYLRYAYHFDAALYAGFLRRYAEKRGVKRVEGKVCEVLRQPESGDLTGVRLTNGQTVSGDFFFDCTGFRSLLMNSLEVPWVDWRHWLPCDRALAVACKHDGPPRPYTRSTAKPAGWQWNIPTQQRTGNGHIYCSEFMSEDEATSSLTGGLDGEIMGAPRLIKFATGHRQKFWEKNCVAIGLSSGFLEPLESTSLYLIRQGISRFIALFPDASQPPILRDEYNRWMQRDFEQVRDLLILHYYANERDEPFWRHCRNMVVPETLERRVALFRAGGRFLRNEGELFPNASWVAVMLGQNVIPRTVDPAIASVPAAEIEPKLALLRRAMNEFADTLPSHEAVLRKYCAAEAG